MATTAKTRYEEQSKFWGIWDRGVKQGMVPGLEKKSRDWFRAEAAKLRITGDVEQEVLKVEKHFVRRELLYNFMYMFKYDAATKATLPYWDMYPLVIPFRFHINPRNGARMMTGINLHYLDRPMRARLMDALHKIVTNKKYNDNQRLRLARDAAANIAKFRWFEPCIHTYYIKNIRSKIYKIPGEYWDIALFMPTERFQKAPKTKVWKDSAAKIRASRGK